jgi:phosphopentomutase
MSDSRASQQVNRVILIVLNSVGFGDAPDADAFGDRGANTLGNTSRAVGGPNLPDPGKLGLDDLTPILTVPAVDDTLGAFVRRAEVSAGKDTIALSTDHLRERVPILIFGKTIKPALAPGTRQSFSGVAATIVDLLKIGWPG